MLCTPFTTQKLFPPILNFIFECIQTNFIVEFESVRHYRFCEFAMACNVKCNFKIYVDTLCYLFINVIQYNALQLLCIFYVGNSVRNPV